ncbi:hypothetical protein UB51_06535 [Paenibacillus sp. IHBB 10380]|nr:hypothetical protein UB51_06535 [Paenibacillus sp. IHBB 10380]
MGNQTYKSSQASTNKPASAQRPIVKPQANRTVPAQVAGAARSSSGTQSKTPAATKNSKKRQPKNRLGQAIVSLIFGIFSIILSIIALLKLVNDALNPYTNQTSATAGFIVLAFLIFMFSLIGFILGIRAKRSTSGRGMAIAGIIMTSPPLFLIILGIGGTILISMSFLSR